MEPDLFEIFSLRTNNIKPNRGRILISEPFGRDDIFKRSVVLLVDYSAEKGAMGFILNKFIPGEKIDYKFLNELGNKKIAFSFGGPVGLENLFYIHTLSGDILEGSQEIIPGLYWGGEYKQLRRMIISNQISTKQIRFFAGYSGWSALQLENEIKNNMWLLKDVTTKEVLTIDEKMWSNQVAQLDEKYKIWNSIPEDAKMN